MQGGVDPLSSPQDGALDGGGGVPISCVEFKKRLCCMSLRKWLCHMSLVRNSPVACD